MKCISYYNNKLNKPSTQKSSRKKSENEQLVSFWDTGFILSFVRKQKY